MMPPRQSSMLTGHRLESIFDRRVWYSGNRPTIIYFVQFWSDFVLLVCAVCTVNQFWELLKFAGAKLANAEFPRQTA